MLSMRRRIARCAFTVAVAAALAACGTFVQVVDATGAPVRDALVAPAWTFLGEFSTTDDEGWARVHDQWLLLAWWLAPTSVVIRTQYGEFEIRYPLPSPIRLPITIAPSETQPEAQH
jgi:hypothetical protein